MAKLLMFSVFDNKVGAFASPFCVRTRGEAIRSFTDAVKDTSLPFVKHPNDYQLYLIAEYDEIAGTVSNGHVPERILGADEVER